MRSLSESVLSPSPCWRQLVWLVGKQEATSVCKELLWFLLGKKYLLLNVVRKSDTRNSFRSHLQVVAVLFLWTSKKFHVKKVTLLVMLIRFLLKLIHKAGVWPALPEKANVKGDLTNVKRFKSISVMMIAVWCCLFHIGDIHTIDSRGTENKKKRGC